MSVLRLLHDLNQLQEGCWGLMDEFHQANPAVVSVLLHEVQAILLAMRAGLATCTIDDGREVKISSSLSVDHSLFTDSKLIYL